LCFVVTGRCGVYYGHGYLHHRPARGEGELYATEGLNREAVHRTVLRADEGLVGLVAGEADAINLVESLANQP
jgi:signal transduction protein with GAF and PtsI domain